MNSEMKKLLKHYRFQFEGLSRPVYYYDLYPTSYKYTNMSNGDWERYRFVQGLKKSPKMDEEKKEKSQKYYKENESQYLQIIRQLIDRFSRELRIGLLSVPSSTKNFRNTVSELITQTVNNIANPNIIDLTNSILRTKDRIASHSVNGSRDLKSNIESLAFNEPQISRIDIIIVIDDVVTSGRSFSAVNYVVENCGFKGEIINFSFARSMHHAGMTNYDSWENCDEISKKIPNEVIGEVKGLIFDFDQTLVDSSCRDENFERRISDGSFDQRKEIVEKESSPYRVYEGIDEVINLNIPFAIVSNSSKNRMQVIPQMDNIQRVLYPEAVKIYKNRLCSSQEIKLYNLIWKYDITDKPWRFILKGAKNIFTPEIDRYGETDTEYVIYSKPHERGVENAKEFLKKTFDIEDGERILGLGNTLEDMIAYRKSGIEAGLVLWGVPELAREYAKMNWHANHVFETPEDVVIYVDSQ